MANHAPFGDVERMLEQYLAPHGHVVTHTPANLRELLDTDHVIRVVRSGGGEDAVAITDQARLVITIHGLANPAQPRNTHDKAATVRAALLNLPAYTAHGRLDKARTESGPVQVPHPDPEVVRVQMIFRVSTRR